MSAGSNPALAALRRARWVFGKELSSFMGSNLPAVSIGIVVFCCGIVSVILTLNPGYTYEAISRALFHFFYIIVIIASLILSMGAFVNERRQGTMELLYTLPVTDLELTLGKFFMGAFLISAISVSMTLVYIAGIAEGPYYIVLSGIVGLLVVGLYAYSVGIFASSLTDSYLVSLLIGGAVLLTIDIGGFLSGLLPEPAKTIFSHMHGLYQFMPFTTGVVPLRGVVFFGSLSVLFLFLTVKVLESRRWRGSN